MVIASIDTGVDYTHPDLYLNIWINQAEIPSARRVNLTDIDGDGLITFWDLNNSVNQGLHKITDINGNGRIDAGDILAPYSASGTGGWADGIDQDPTVNGVAYNRVDDLIGWDYRNNDNNPYDDNSHGTHTTGTFAAIGNNSVGITGVNWRVQVMVLKFLDSNGTGTALNGASAIRYAADHGSRVSNNSWGGGGNTTLSNAIVYAGNQGHVVVAAAGNNGSNNDITPFYPSSYSHSNIIAVAATTSSGGLAGYSNYGATRVDLGAPGSGIYSTTPGGYGYKDGTSMATPHVTGVVGLLLARNPNLTVSQLVNTVLSTTTSLSSLAGKTVTGGLLNAQAALASLNNNPVLASISDRTVPASQDIVTVPLSATDADGDPLTFSATAQSLAYVLDQQLGLAFTGNLYLNYGGANEKWLLGSGDLWYFIKPNGELWRWDGTPNQATGTLIGNVGSSYYTQINLLYSAVANQPHAALSISGTTLTIDRENGFVGGVVVTVTVNDGRGGTDSKTFTVTVTDTSVNNPPVLAPINNQTVPPSQDIITVSLSATDADGDPLTYSATAQSLAYVLDQQLGLTFTGNLYLNWGGLNEKWLLGSGDQWHFIKPNGELFRWDGSSQATGALIGNVGSSYHTQINLLYDAVVNQPHAALSISGTTLKTLTIDRENDFFGSVVVTVTVSDGRGGFDSKTFTVTVGSTGGASVAGTAKGTRSAVEVFGNLTLIDPASVFLGDDIQETGAEDKLFETLLPELIHFSDDNLFQKLIRPQTPPAEQSPDDIPFDLQVLEDLFADESDKLQPGFETRPEDDPNLSDDWLEEILQPLA